MRDTFRRYTTCASIYKGAGISTLPVVGYFLPQLANNAVPCYRHAKMSYINLGLLNQMNMQV